LVEGSSTAFIQALQNAFGYRSGLVVDVSEISAYPLALTQLIPFYTQGVVAIGNSAQSLHPIAGQGVNLGFRDVFELVQHLKVYESQSLGSYAQLSRYADIRTSDKQETISLTDGLVSLFSNDYLPLVSGRNIALTAMNAIDSVKSTFAKRAMGFKHAAF
jgi:2-octaprenyl-6-methoxyphenol hydroxylase